MKVLVLMAETDHVARWDAADDDHRARVVADFTAFDAAVAARGEVLGGEALAPATEARTVRPGTDAVSRVVTDGPYAETTEQLGGFYLIEVESLDAAVELVRLLPREYDVEVREVVDVSF